MSGNWLNLVEAPARDLQALHRGFDLSVVHYAASVADKTMPQAVLGLMKAMGKDENVTGMRMHPSDSVQVLPVWLAAHETKVVLLSRTQSWQRPHILTDLIRVLAATPTTVIVATDPGAPGNALTLLRGMSPVPIAADTIPALVAQATNSTVHEDTQPDPSAPRSQVPSSDWPTFRYDCRNTLPDDDFRRIDAAYVEAFTEARTALAASPPTNNSTLDLITHILHTRPDTTAAITAFRATQAAHFQAGYNLRLNPRRLISLYAHSRPPEFTDRDWLALRAYRDPARPAACTLYAHGLTVPQIKKFTIDDAQAALANASLNDRLLNRHATTYLTANLIHQDTNGAHPADPFIPLKGVAQVLVAAGKDVGILTAGKPTHTSIHTKAIWTAGTGFLLKPIS